MADSGTRGVGYIDTVEALGERTNAVVPMDLTSSHKGRTNSTAADTSRSARGSTLRGSVVWRA